MSADVIPFPQPEPRKPACFICFHALVGAKTYCSLFEEIILDEFGVAKECEQYREDPDLI